MIPQMSDMIIFTNPYDRSIFAMETPAAPAPEMTILTSSFFFPTTFSAFMRPARTITAVPC